MNNFTTTYSNIFAVDADVSSSMRKVRDVLLAWGGIPAVRSENYEWLEFCSESARHVSSHLRRENLEGLADGDEFSPQQIASLVFWADERAAWESCWENRRHLSSDLCAELDLAGHDLWLGSIDAPQVETKANRQRTPLLAEIGRAAGKARYCAYVACIHAFSCGDADTRQLILSPYNNP